MTCRDLRQMNAPGIDQTSKKGKEQALQYIGGEESEKDTQKKEVAY